MSWIDEIVGKWTKKEVYISQKTVDYLLWYCDSKMDVAKIENKEEYLPLLFEDELKDYLFRQSINATTILRMMGGHEECAVCV